MKRKNFPDRVRRRQERALDRLRARYERIRSPEGWANYRAAMLGQIRLLELKLGEAAE